MSFSLVLVPYALAYVAVAIRRLYKGKPSADAHGGDDMLHSSRLQVLKLVTFARMALLAVAVISAGTRQKLLPTILLAQSPTGERFAGALTGHVMAAMLLELLSCPPVLSLLLAVGSLALGTAERPGASGIFNFFFG